MPQILTPNRFFNVKDRFGARGNDSSDDTARIQLAFDEHASATGTPVLTEAWASGVYFPLPSARYLITSPITIKAGQRAWAETIGTIINYAGSDAEAGAFRIVGDTNGYSNDVIFDHLSIYTNAGSGIYCGADYDFAKVIRDNAGTWTDQTTPAAQVYDATFACFAGANDWLYVGSATTFATFVAIFSTLCVNAVFEADYWNGTTWTDLTLTLQSTLGGRDIQLYWNIPGDWAQTNAEAFSSGNFDPPDSTNRYYVRIRYTTAGADATQQCYVAGWGSTQPLGLKVRDCLFSTAKTSMQLMKAYIQDAEILGNQWRSGGADLVFGRGNHATINYNRGETGFRSGGAEHAAFIRWLGGDVHCRYNHVEHGGPATPYHLGGMRGSIFGEWSEMTSYTNDTAAILDLADYKQLEFAPSASNVKLYVNFSKGVRVSTLAADGDARATEFGVVLRSISEDPNTSLYADFAAVKYQGEVHDPRITIRRSYSTVNQWHVNEIMSPRTGNLIRNGDFVDGLGDSAGSTNITITIESGATITATVEDSPRGGKRLKLAMTANTLGTGKVATVRMSVGTLASFYSDKPGWFSFRATTSIAYDLPTGRPVVLVGNPDGGVDYCRSGGGGVTRAPLTLASGDNLDLRWYGTSTVPQDLYIEDVCYVIGREDDGMPNVFTDIRNPAGITLVQSIVVLGGDVTNDNGTPDTIADVTGLSFPVSSGLTYEFRFVIPFTSAADTTGSRWSVNGPASPTLLNYVSKYTLTTGSFTERSESAYDQPSAANATSVAAGSVAIIEGTIKPSANGTVIARFASEVGSSAVVAKAGAFVRWGRVA